MQILFLRRTRKSKPRVKSEPRKQQYTVRLFDCKHLAHVIVLWQMQKFMCYCTLFALFNFEFEGNFQVQAPGGLYLEGRFKGGFLRYEVGGLYLEGLIHGEAYFQNFTVTPRYVRGPLCYSFKFLCTQQCTVQYRKWSRDRKGSPKWTANDSQPQVIPKVDRKWSRI